MYILHQLKQTIEGVHGEKGLRWLAALPDLLDECRRHWLLELEPPFDNLSYNFVLPGRTQQGAEIVLKLGVPCNELMTEAAALVLFDGKSAARLLAKDLSNGALLLERILPGTPLSGLRNEAEEIRIAARLMRRLWRAPPAEHPFPTLAIWFRAFKRVCNQPRNGAAFPREIVARAERTFSGLQNSSARQIVLHGDLHHANILSSTDNDWRAIDPKGIVGDCGYEVGSFMLNQLPCAATDNALQEIFNYRLELFADELGISRKRLANWAFCHAVLSAAWSFEDGEEWHETLRLAQILEKL